MALPKISVILPVRNEAGCIGELLDQLLQQTYPADRFEILVADGRSTDATRKVVEEKATKGHVFLRVVDNPGMRSGAGRNAGIAAASGDVVVFIDGHCQIPSRTLLEDTIQMLEQTGADCLCRPQPLIANHPRGVGRIIANARASTLGHGRDSLIYDMTHTGFVDPASSGATYRRAVFEKVGGYDETFDACEDVEFNTRVAAAGFRAYTDPRVAVYYEPRKSFAGLFRQMVRYGVGRVRLSRKHPSAASLSQWVPAVLVAGLIVGALAAIAASLLHDWRIAVLAVPAFLFVLITIMASLDLGRRHGLLHAFLGPVAYCTIYAGLGAGMWAELFRPSNRTLQVTGVFSSSMSGTSSHQENS